MGDHSKAKKRIMCINCNLCLNRMHRNLALLQDPHVTGVICSWVHPVIVTEEDYICDACRDFAITSATIKQEVPTSQDDEVVSTNYRYNSACLLCGYSIVSRSSNIILKENPTEIQEAITNLIQSKVEPRKIHPPNRVCRPCWLRTKREVLRTQREAEVSENNLNGAAVSPDISSREESVIEQVNVPTKPVIEQISLPNYRRAANSASHCVFPNCQSKSLHRVKDQLRVFVLSSHKYYIPDLARICDEHLLSNMWHTLFDSQNSYTTFTVKQIQHVFSFVGENQTLDFENIMDIDDAVFKYIVGKTKLQFHNILQKVPRVYGVRRGSLGLAMLLLKARTGISGDKISELVNIPRRTIEKIMLNVKEVLLQENFSI